MNKEYLEEEDISHKVIEVNIRTQQSLRNCEELVQHCQAIKQELHIKTEKEYLYPLTSYNCLRGLVEGRVIPFLDNISLQISLLANEHDKLFEVMRYVLATVEARDKPIPEPPIPDLREGQQHDVDNGKTKDRKNTDRK